MKKHNILAFLALGLIFTACNDDKKNENNLLTIDSSKLKQTYNQNETLPLEVLNPNNVAIDSVVYFSEDTKIGSSKQNNLFNYSLVNEKFGSKHIKAVIYSNGNQTETSLLINVFSNTQPELVNYTVINTYPHDINAYTQGLEFYGDLLIESTGNGIGQSGKKGKSSVRKVNPKTGEILKINELPDAIFGEGATILNNKLYQLTYQNNEAYVYNLETLEKEQTLPYFKKMEGWGLTNDGTNLYMTDGSDKIYIINPQTFELIDYIVVSSQNNTIPAINELEWVNGKIYANIYTNESAIVTIDPKNGAIESIINLSDLRTKVTQHIDLDVLNGIAYNKNTDTFFVTGKNWDKMFEIKISK